MLRDFNPDIIGTLSKTTAIFRDEERYFDIIVTKSLMKLISRKTDARIELFLAPFGIMDTVIRRRVLRRAIDETRGLRGISFMHIEDIISLIKDGCTGDRLYLPKGVRVIKGYSTVVFTSEPPVRLNACPLNVPGETILKETGVVLKAALSENLESKTVRDKGLWTVRGVFDADTVQFPLSVRARENGDFFHPAGFGRRKKLQDFFVDLKIPRDERDRVPLIMSGDDIIWVVGYRGDERFRVTGDTKTILQIEIKKMRD
jgi:tRNA(Ile)-lysidine synthase